MKSTNNVKIAKGIKDVGSGRIESVIFQKNGVIRSDKRYMTKEMLKKIAKDRK